MSKKSTIAICSSVTFYKQVVELKQLLEKQGKTVFVPKLVVEMEKSGDFNLLSYQERYDSTDPERKKTLISEHFKVIETADSILVANFRKHKINGYIGPNVLMEMTIAFYLGKPIFLLFPIDETVFCYDEVMGMGATVLAME